MTTTQSAIHVTSTRYHTKQTVLTSWYVCCEMGVIAYNDSKTISYEMGVLS